MIGYITKRNFLLSSVSLLTSLSVYTKRRQLLAKQSPPPPPPQMIWQSGRQMFNHRNNAITNNTNTNNLWIRDAHMFDVDIENLKNTYKYNVVILVGFSYTDNSFQSTGTGVIVDVDENIVVTNAHVVAGYYYMHAYTKFPSPTIQLPEQTRIEKTNILVAHVLYIEEHLDLALVKLVEMDLTGIPLPFMQLSDRPYVLGEQVAFLGHGDGQLWTIYVGYITANTPFDTIWETHFIPLASQYDKSESFCLHQSNIITGTSGSPMVDSNFEIIGINFATLQLSNSPSTATHSKTVNDFIERAGEFIESDERRDQQLDQLKQQFHPKSDNQLGIVLVKNIIDNITTGFMVTDIIDNRTTELVINDLILEINGQPFTDISQLTELTIASFGIDIELKINRNSNIMTVIANSFQYDIIPLVV
ncbi:uncharacterized protein LOC128962878 [Oppia nitens]|uniref:uncharacterized protein LOC128962878 n=1 Tax=Oppia nitens TaxID=1686743 RepID=UPI0023DA5AFD|nr:uncharacterized protein LOC128962878 [Oppia nitens]